MDKRDKVFLEEERALVELPAILKAGLVLFAVLVGVSLLFFPWNIVLFLFIGLCLIVGIFFNLYVGVIVFLVGAYLHPTALFPALQPFHIARNLSFLVMLIWLFHITVYKDFRLVRTPQNFFVMGLALTLLFSCFRYFEYSFPIFIEIMSKALVLYFIITNIVKTQKKVLIIIGVLILLGTISSCVGFYQYINGIGLKLVGDTVRIFGTTQNPNTLAAELVLIVPIIAALFKNVKLKSIKAILLISLGIIITAIILTFSRAGMVTLLIVLALSFTRFMFPDKKPLIAILFSLLVISLVVLLVLPLVPQEYLSRMKTITHLEEISIASRLEAWRLAAKSMFENPFIGVGFGVFKYAFLTQALTSPDMKTKFILLHAHNMYLHVGAEAGVFAFIFLLSIIFYAWRQLKKASIFFMQNNNPMFSNLATALEISLTGFFLMNMFSWHLDLLIFWILIAISCVLKELSISK